MIMLSTRYSIRKKGGAAKMKKAMVVLLALLLAIPLVAGCGQNQQPQDEKRPIIVKSKDVAANIEEAKEEAAAVKAVVEPVVQQAPKVEEAVAISKAEVSAVPAQEASKAAAIPASYSEEIVVADFNSGEKPNNLGGNFGAWNKDPSDPTQWCKEGFDNVTKHGDTGFAMKLDYSVDSPNPAYNGFWLTLPNFDATKYDALNIWVKGDPRTGYTTVFKLELKGANNQVGRFYVSNVTDQWQEISVPLSEFKGLADRTCLTELVLVLEDRMASNKKGVLYIDDIKFVRK
jgi:hypothetical protein